MMAMISFMSPPFVMPRCGAQSRTVPQRNKSVCESAEVGFAQNPGKRLH
jgi:hypothetical protein